MTSFVDAQNPLSAAIAMDADSNDSTVETAKCKKCASGVYVDGQCCLDSGLRVPEVGGGAKGFYTTYSFGFTAVALAVFLFALLPAGIAIPDNQLWQSPLVMYGALPMVAAACINSISVFATSQTMMAHDYRLWHKSDDDRDVAVSADMFGGIMWNNFMWHTLPMLVAIMVMGATVRVADTGGRMNKWIFGGSTLAWLVAFGLVYLALPVSKETRGFHELADNDVEPKMAKPKMVNGTEKVDVVYAHHTPVIMGGLVTLNVLGVVVSSLLFQ